MDCVFCKIISGDIPSYTIYDDDIVKVFLDINPDANGHLLIIPKKHILDLNDMDEDTLLHIMNIAKKYRLILEEKLKIDGLTLIQNNGMIQEVKHFHLHLKPYYKEKQPLKKVEEIYEILKSLD
ncbi:MAG: HIT domain-containing protein [Bacilli bacterium]|nr:HIT domain-containing protein [Bacilli bacterium]MDD4608325.1 HIT domain-containing protein [Bacilli bacterium]